MFVPVLEISTHLRKNACSNNRGYAYRFLWTGSCNLQWSQSPFQTPRFRMTSRSFFLQLLYMRIFKLICRSNKNPATGKPLSSPKQRCKYFRRCLKYRQFDQIFLIITRIIPPLASKTMHWKGSRYVFGRWPVRKSEGTLPFLTQVSLFLHAIHFSKVPGKHLRQTIASFFQFLAILLLKNRPDVQLGMGFFFF